MKYTSVLVLILPLYVLSCGEIPDALCGLCHQNFCYFCHLSYPDISGECLVPSNKIPNCISYRNESTCIQCKQGYYPDKLSCEKNSIDGCIEASNHLQCDKCDGHLLNEDFLCDSSIECQADHCQSCEFTLTGQECTKCYKGYVLDLDLSTMEFSCIEETQNLYGCHIAFDQQCKKCHPGYFDTELESESDQQNHSSIFCKKNQEYEIEEHFELDFSCKKGKDRHCLECSQNGCKTCSQGFPSSKGLCIRPKVPIPGCETYSSEGLCEVCFDGYYYNGSQCIQKNIRYCFDPQSDSKCSYCDGVLKKQDGTCDSSSKCQQENCLSCELINGKNQCTRCKDAYTLDGHDFSCVREVPEFFGCLLLNQRKCLVCKNGYYVSHYDSQGYVTCLRAETYTPGESLILLDKDPSCLSFNDQYCGACADEKCSLCYNSFKNIFGVCEEPQSDIEGCLEYSSLLDCQNCKLGYYEMNGKCIKITIPNCLKQDSVTKKCLQCDSSLLLPNGYCDVDYDCSIKGCQSCSLGTFSNEQCQKCNDGYILKRYATTNSKSIQHNCQLNEYKYGEGCEMISGDKCIKCKYGYYVSGKHSNHSIMCSKSQWYNSAFITISTIIYILLIV